MVLKRRLFIGITSVLTMAACTPRIDNSFDANKKDNSQIVGGTSVQDSDPLAKSVVGLIIRNKVTGSEEYCTGALLANNLILTAAHCATDLDGPVDIYAIFKSSINTNNYVKKDVRTIDFKSVFRTYGTKTAIDDVDTGDIALLHYKGSTPAGFEPSRLMVDDSSLTSGSKLIVVGYGASSVNKQPIDINTYPDIIGAIQEGRVICESNIELKNCYEMTTDGAGDLRKATVAIDKLIFSPSEMSVDQTSGSGICHGDSGGPAYAFRGGRYYLVGITSRLSADDTYAECNKKSIFSSIPYYYYNWIKPAGEKLVAAAKKK